MHPGLAIKQSHYASFCGNSVYFTALRPKSLYNPDNALYHGVCCNTHRATASRSDVLNNRGHQHLKPDSSGKPYWVPKPSLRTSSFMCSKTLQVFFLLSLLTSFHIHISSFQRFKHSLKVYFKKILYHF